MNYFEIALQAWLAIGLVIFIGGTWADPATRWSKLREGIAIAIGFVLVVILWPLALWVLIRDAK
jgi:hypothetical protein